MNRRRALLAAALVAVVAAGAAVLALLAQIDDAFDVPIDPPGQDIDADLVAYRLQQREELLLAASILPPKHGLNFGGIA